MILLDSDNAILLETLNKYNKSKSNNGNDDNDNKNNNNLDIHFDDHSESHFHLKIQNNEIILSLRLPAWRDISKRAELVNLIKEQYSGMWRDVDGSDRENYDISVGSELSELTDERIVLMSQLRQKVLSAPLNLAIQQLTTVSPKTTQPSAAPITITLNSIGDSFTVAGGVGGDQIIVLFATRFTDKTDTILAKVFLQEFHDTRKVNLSIQDAPAVLFGREPPKELSNLNLKLNSSSTSASSGSAGSAGSDDLNFITFVLFPRHFQTSQQIENLLKTLPTFRDYLHYHIKCSKAYLHQRMRGKTGDFLKLLNRAKPENF